MKRVKNIQGKLICAYTYIYNIGQKRVCWILETEINNQILVSNVSPTMRWAWVYGWRSKIRQPFYVTLNGESGTEGRGVE